MKRFISICIVVAFAFPLNAWYPEYSILVSEYRNMNEFLKPLEFRSIEAEALGKYFLPLYPGETDLVFRNPAYTGLTGKNSVSLTFDRNAGGEDRDSRMYGGMYYDQRIAGPYVYPNQPIDKDDGLNPLVQAFAIKRINDRVAVGSSFEYFYDRKPFYQPSWYWGPMRYEDGMGTAMEDGAKDPNGSYEVVSAAENLETMEGFHWSGFVAFKMGRAVSIGLKAAMKDRATEGSYRDLDIENDAPWAMEYESHYDLNKKGASSNLEKEVALGLIYSREENSEFGLSLGYISGTDGKDYSESDTSYYYSSYSGGSGVSGMNEYISGNYYQSVKNWDYSGSTIYGTIHGKMALREGLDLNFLARSEITIADLSEKEEMIRRSSYSSDWYSQYDSMWYRYNSRSSSTNSRPGAGNLARSKKNYGIGLAWKISPVMTLIGGAVYDDEHVTLDAVEPFEGYSTAWHWSSTLAEEETENSLNEVKSFDWEFASSQRVMAFPAGVIITPNEVIEIRLGLTKVIETADEAERYDMIVSSRTARETVNGTETVTERFDYVEAYELPGVHTFNDGVDIHIGGSLTLNEHIKLTGALLSSDFAPDKVRLGLTISW